jgi:hypothetical protein
VAPEFTPNCPQIGVTPANAGVHAEISKWIPAFAGMTSGRSGYVPSTLGRIPLDQNIEQGL